MINVLLSKRIAVAKPIELQTNMLQDWRVNNPAT